MEKYKWVARKNGKVVAEATSAKELFIQLNELQIRGVITQLVRVRELTEQTE